MALVPRANGGQTTTARVCGVDQSHDAQLYFADPVGTKKWREYRREMLPKLSNDAGEGAQVWLGRGGSTLVKIELPGDDYLIATDYCFDPTGRLVHLRLEVRTAWDWAYREEGAVRNGILSASSSEFFSPNSNKPISGPVQAVDVPELRKPRIYPRKSQLPFSKLLPK